MLAKRRRPPVAVLLPLDEEEVIGYATATCQSPFTTQYGFVEAYNSFCSSRINA